MKKVLFFLFIFLNISYSFANKPLSRDELLIVTLEKEFSLYKPTFPKVPLILGKIEIEDPVFLGKTFVVEIIRDTQRLVDDISTVGRINVKSRFSYKRKQGYVKITIYF